MALCSQRESNRGSMPCVGGPGEDSVVPARRGVQDKLGGLYRYQIGFKGGHWLPHRRSLEGSKRLSVRALGHHCIQGRGDVSQLSRGNLLILAPSLPWNL